MPNPVDYYMPGYMNISQPKLRGEKFDDDDDDDDSNITIIIIIIINSQSLTRLNLHPNTYIQLQKSVILGTFSIVRNFLNYK